MGKVSDQLVKEIESTEFSKNRVAHQMVKNDEPSIEIIPRQLQKLLIIMEMDQDNVTHLDTSAAAIVPADT